MYRGLTHIFFDTSSRAWLRFCGILLTGAIAIACSSRGEDAKQVKAPPNPCSRSDAPLVWIGATGDVMPGRGSADLLSRSDGPEKAFGGLLPLMRGEDLLIANLETSVTERGSPWPKTYRFRVSPALLAPLQASGIDLVALSNNHVYDYGEEGFLDTLRHLRAAGLPYVGAGRDVPEAARPWSGRIGGEEIRVWSLGAYPVERTGFNGLRDASVQRGRAGLLWADDMALAELSRQFSDIDRRSGGAAVFRIVCLHAGTEYSNDTTEGQRALCRRLIALGANLVIAHHPHVLESLEWYEAPEQAGVKRSGLIAYSLGNYLFDGMDGIPFADEGLLLSVGIRQGTIEAIRLDGARLSGPSVDLDRSGAIAQRLRAMSPSAERLISGKK